MGKIKIGVSTCLLGESVRYDGTHKRDSYLSDYLAQFVDWVPVCPEMEVGMGVPRESVQLIGSAESPRMIGTRSKKDWTNKMNSFANSRSRELTGNRLSGFIFKARSPSCGLTKVVIRPEEGGRSLRGVGLFSAAVIKANPLLPVEDEGRLNDSRIRENFITRVFSYHRLQELFENGFKRGQLVEFHTAQKYLLLAHSPKHYSELGRLVANLKKYKVSELKVKYSDLYMEALKNKATVRKNVNVLQHMLGYFKKLLESDDRKRLLGLIEDYRLNYIPLVVPMTLLAHFVQKYKVKYLMNQTCLYPHPKELMLRNHV